MRCFNCGGVRKRRRRFEQAIGGLRQHMLMSQFLAHLVWPKAEREKRKGRETEKKKEKKRKANKIK